MRKLSADQQLRELRVGVDEILMEKDLAAKLERSVAKNEPLNVKAGFDPTAPDLHLGHTVVLQKMARFQEFGHRAVFLIGDFTGLVGDPSGRSKTRPQLTREEVAKNAETYKRQVFKILDPERTEVRFNSEWLEKLGAIEFVRLASHANVARMLEREDFKNRFRENVSISVHEFLYPLLQAYDSVALRADVELGGRDQRFNLLLGRELMRDYGLEPQVCLTVPILEGLDGVQKMSKSLGNYVGVDEAPDAIFGKLMSVPDTLMRRYYELLSTIPLADLETLFRELAEGKHHPKAVKARFAMEIVARFHSADAATAAQETFERVVSRKELPDDLPEVAFPLPPGEALWVPKLLQALDFVKTTSEGKRLIVQGGVKIDEAVVTEEKLAAPPESFVLRCGKRKFARVTLRRG
jgi:tyrosyl-tRNA synthetase